MSAPVREVGSALVCILNAIQHGGPVPAAVLKCWPHERVVNEGYATVTGRGALLRYKLTPRGLRILELA